MYSLTTFPEVALNVHRRAPPSAPRDFSQLGLFGLAHVRSSTRCFSHSLLKSAHWLVLILVVLAWVFFKGSFGEDALLKGLGCRFNLMLVLCSVGFVPFFVSSRLCEEC